MGALVCSKVSARKASFIIAVTAVLFLFSFMISEFGKNFQTVGVGATSSTDALYRRSGLLSRDEINEVIKRRTRYSNRRLLLSELCTKSDISIFQGEMNPLPNGIPTFNVQIINLCTVGCPISSIHVACGWFASAKLINPEIFRRIDFNDCLVNDGKPLNGGDSISFEYSNSFEYPMRVQNAAICMETRPEFKSTTQSLAANFRDLVTHRVGRSVVVSTRNRRFLVNNMCTDKDISITQSRDGTTGIPLYSVQITNTCMSDCAPSDIHVNCGWFASSPPPNPNVFTRLAFNDCLVNGGRPLLQGNIIQFQYANSFMYPLTFKSAKFCRV